MYGSIAILDLLPNYNANRRPIELLRYQKYISKFPNFENITYIFFLEKTKYGYVELNHQNGNTI